MIVGQGYSQADTFWGILNVSLRAFGAQLGLDSANLMLFHFLLSTFKEVRIKHYKQTDRPFKKVLIFRDKQTDTAS